MDYRQLIDFFDEYNAHYRSFLQFEYAKMDMLNKGEIEKLSASLSTEQAFIMKGNQLEAQRLRLIGADESSPITFAELIDKAPAEYKPRLDEQYKALSEMVYKIKELNDMANIIVTQRLKRIRSSVGELDTYNGRGNVKKESGAPSSTIMKNV